MSALVRCFAHTGVTTAPVNPGSGRYTTDSVALLKQPYLAREAVTASGTATSTGAGLTTSTATKLLYVQVEDGKTVAIEVNPPNRSVTADTSSPRHSGSFTLEAGPGWTLSIVEIT